MVNKLKLFQGGWFRLRSFYLLTTWSNMFITIRRKYITNSSTWEFCFRSCLIDFFNHKRPAPSPQKSNGRPIAGGKGDAITSRLRPIFCHFSTYTLHRTILGLATDSPIKTIICFRRRRTFKKGLVVFGQQLPEQNLPQDWLYGGW